MQIKEKRKRKQNFKISAWNVQTGDVVVFLSLFYLQSKAWELKRFRNKFLRKKSFKIEIVRIRLKTKKHNTGEFIFNESAPTPIHSISYEVSLCVCLCVNCPPPPFGNGQGLNSKT